MTKKYPSIDYAFRPASYWEAPDPLAAILQNVKGENRRKMIRDFWDAGRLDELDPKLLGEGLDQEIGDALSRVDTSFMGGEYLPDYRPLEVEIARICLASMMSDVVSIRARPTGRGISYRAVDEHDGRYRLTVTESSIPVSLEELVRLLDEGQVLDDEYAPGLALCFNDYNVAEGSSREAERGFTRIESDAYPQLNEHYERVFDDWLAEGAGK